jgi:hypothetical protein
LLPLASSIIPAPFDFGTSAVLAVTSAADSHAFLSPLARPLDSASMFSLAFLLAESRMAFLCENFRS